MMDSQYVKRPAHGAGLFGKDLFDYIVPLEPACKAGLAGALLDGKVKSFKCKARKF